MQKSLEALQKVIEHATELSHINENFSYDDLVEYLFVKSKTESNAATFRTIDRHSPKAGRIAYLIGRMNRFARIYNKEALKQTEFSTMEEFSFSATLCTRPNMRKSDLVNENMTEVPAGMSIIKRLVSKGIIKEAEDPIDKRAQLVSLTEQGKKAIQEAFVAMTPIAQTIIADLSLEKQDVLLEILHHLDDFHSAHMQLKKKF